MSTEATGSEQQSGGDGARGSTDLAKRIRSLEDDRVRMQTAAKVVGGIGLGVLGLVGWALVSAQSAQATASSAQALIVDTREEAIGSLNQHFEGLLEGVGEQVMSRAVPAGTVIAWPIDELPEGWLICDGQELRRDEYPVLAAAFEKSGFPYDEGVPTTAGLFRIPDYRGLFLRGLDDPDGPAGAAPAGLDREAGRQVGSFQGDSTSAVGLFFRGGVIRPSHSGGSGLGLGPGSEAVRIDRGEQPLKENDAETRPANRAVIWIIYAGPRAD